MCFAWNALFDYVSNAYQYLNYMYCAPLLISYNILSMLFEVSLSLQN